MWLLIKCVIPGRLRMSRWMLHIVPVLSSDSACRVLSNEVSLCEHTRCCARVRDMAVILRCSTRDTLRLLSRSGINCLLLKRASRMPAKLNINTGDVFGKLTVQHEVAGLPRINRHGVRRSGVNYSTLIWRKNNGYVGDALSTKPTHIRKTT